MPEGLHTSSLRELAVDEMPIRELDQLIVTENDLPCQDVMQPEYCTYGFRPLSDPIMLGKVRFW